MVINDGSEIEDMAAYYLTQSFALRALKLSITSDQAYMLKDIFDIVTMLSTSETLHIRSEIHDTSVYPKLLRLLLEIICYYGSQGP